MIRPVKTEVECSSSERFAPHAGRQLRVRWFFVCGCDAGYCEAHSHRKDLTFERGAPRKCRDCQAVEDDHAAEAAHKATP